MKTRRVQGLAGLCAEKSYTQLGLSFQMGRYYVVKVAHLRLTGPLVRLRVLVVFSIEGAGSAW
ncbi:hypothetical protein AWV77_22755 [Pseudomonas palleroniana]|uniref:Uncharacterized protein n=1 Tax=Pseudomonas palleroniana TaxID=191390 RepID=A0A0X7JYW6_9PSED|nr:hypothetical protein AWV77_22755 [Pseudomonas palleroniana]